MIEHNVIKCSIVIGTGYYYLGIKVTFFPVGLLPLGKGRGQFEPELDNVSFDWLDLQEMGQLDLDLQYTSSHAKWLLDTYLWQSDVIKPHFFYHVFPYWVAKMFEESQGEVFGHPACCQQLRSYVFCSHHRKFCDTMVLKGELCQHISIRVYANSRQFCPIESSFKLSFDFEFRLTLFFGLPVMWLHCFADSLVLQ